MKRIYPLLFGCLLLTLLSACSRNEDEEPAGVLAEGAVKILVEQNGLYQVTLAELQEAGLTLDEIMPDAVSLSQDGQSIPYHIADDALVFYGAAPESRYVTARPYILRAGTAGQTISEVANATAGEQRLSEINFAVHLEQDSLYASNARNAVNDETWFWQTIRPQRSVAITATLPYVGNGPATATFELYGVTYDHNSAIDHDFDVVINGRNLGTIAWDGQTWQQSSVTVPAGTLRTGHNEILIDNSVPGAVEIDTMHLNWLRLDIAAPPVAIDDRLTVSDVAGLVPMSGFSAPPLIFNVTDAEAPTLISGWNFISGIAEIGVAAEQTIMAVGPNGFLRPAQISGVRASDWRNTTNQADLLIITSDTMIPALAPLVAHREAQGLAVAVVPVAEIYDEFGYGAASPESIQRFVKYASDSWAAPAPKYLFLVGDATYDYRGYLGPVPNTAIPSLIVPVAFSGETVSDARLADIDGDKRPDLAVGRWPVNSVAETEELVERTIAYEEGDAAKQAIFTADGTEAQFATISDRFVTSSNMVDDAIARLYGASESEVTDVWNEGAWLVTYTGHGSLDKWGKDDVLSNEAVAELNKADFSPPIVLQFTCLTGFFAHPTVQSISETLLANDAGPVLLLGATSLTLSTHQEPLAIGLLNELQNSENRRIGDALAIAKANLDISNDGIREVNDTFGLLGDPSAIIIRPHT